MKIVKALSLFAVLVTLTVITTNLFKNFELNPLSQTEKNVQASTDSSDTDDTPSVSFEEKFLESPVNMNMQQLSALLETDSFEAESLSNNDAEKNDAVLALFEKINENYKKLIEENEKLKEELDALKKSQGDEEKKESSFNLSNTDTQMFLAKAVFSFLFCISALYVVLSDKYDEDKTKWAFSVLSLIAGVWIGTM